VIWSIPLPASATEVALLLKVDILWIEVAVTFSGGEDRRRNRCPKWFGEVG